MAKIFKAEVRMNLRIICWLVGIYEINLLLPLHIENNGDIVLFIFISPTIRAKDLLLLQTCLTIGVS